MRETEIQASICEYLQYKQNRGQLMFWRQNNTPVFSDGRMRALPKHSRRGVPDIIVIKQGQFIGLEVKTSKGRLSKSQKDFRDDVRNIGCAEYEIVRSVEDVQSLGL